MSAMLSIEVFGSSDRLLLTEIERVRLARTVSLNVFLALTDSSVACFFGGDSKGWLSV